MNKQEAIGKVQQMDLAEKIASLSETNMACIKVYIEQTIFDEQKSAESGRKNHSNNKAPDTNF